MGFEQCHPAVNFIFYAFVIAASAIFNSPAFVAVSFVCSFAYSVKKNGKRAVVFNSALVALSALFALYYASYTHFGVTVLGKNFIGNNITLESIVFGAVTGLKISSVVMWFSSLFRVFPSDKTVYLFGRVSPRLSLFLSILLRTVPKIKKDASQINSARRALGKGAGQGNLFKRIKNSVSLVSALITRTVESFVASSDSMRSRGSLLRGRRAFSIYRFDNRDRVYVVAMFAAAAATVCGASLGTARIVYDPKIVLPPPSALAFVSCGAYLVFCLMPLALDLFTEYSFSNARKRTFETIK